MNRQILITTVAVMLFQSALAQNTQEWTQQKKTQIQYLVQQVAALQMYLNYLKKGYDIVQTGHNLIGDIKNGNLNDHSTYFNSLKIVKPFIKESSKATLISILRASIGSDLSRLDSECAGSENLLQPEKRLVSEVRQTMEDYCNRQVQEFNAVVTDQATQMKDDERIERIDRIYEEMVKAYSFTRSFCNSTLLLIDQRAREKSEVDRSLKLSGQ